MNTKQARVIDPILTQVALGYRHAQHVGTALFPRVPVMQRGGQVLQFGRESFRLYDALRAPGAATKSIETGYLGKAFGLQQHALEGKVPREHQQEASRVPGVDLGEIAVRTPLQALSLRLEYDQAQIARDADNYDADHKVDLAASKWSDDANSPFSDIDDGREAIRDTVGLYPNTMLLSAKAFRAARNNAKVIERFKYTSRESITAEMLAAMWDIDNVVVGQAVAYDDQDGPIDVWGADVVLAYVAQSAASRDEPSYGYTYTLQGHPMVEKPYYDDNRKSWMYPVTDERSAELTGMVAGYLIQNAA